MQAGYGANPALPAPNPGLIPTVNVAPAVGWPADTTPQAASGLAVNECASRLDHPRWLHVLPNGDVLVAESNAPAQHDAGSGLKGVVMGLVMAREPGRAYRVPTASVCCATRTVSRLASD